MSEHKMEQDETPVDLRALALGDAPKRHQFTWRGATFEVKEPTEGLKERLKAQASEPVMEYGKPVKVNGVTQYKRNDAKFGALLLVNCILYPGQEKQVFTKADVETLTNNSGAEGSFIAAAQEALLSAMTGKDRKTLEEEEEGNSEGTAASGS